MKFPKKIAPLFCLAFMSISGLAQSQKADDIVDKAIAKHGGDLYEQRTVSFTFRGQFYQGAHRTDGTYFYRKESTKGKDKFVSKLTNEKFTQTKNGEEIVLDPRLERAVSNGVNSVFYFALLPYKLNDDAVHKKLVGETTIKGQKYWVVQVSFAAEGGGDDHDDQFVYWFNQKTYTMDYLAYSYHVNKGGVRFRQAINARNVEGIMLQDYINYKADVGTDMAKLPELFEAGKLKELSKILIENEKVVPQL